ncbi:MAG TPA: ABC transporter permease [Bacteroidales bacterium]|nr:MAG: ABC transporter permease [Bacteroidetes bacterium GWF2_35_48]OFY93528.1 MAG: ABC transporter permease [Bacteroidetes bacterium RIFOXYC12_FULL_35_7]HBX51750.1 ABC transporter permease [Bacteroidales bacterium]
MNKIFLIIQREYLTRVRKKTFIIMTIVGPILMAALMIAPVIFAKMDQEEHKVIAVVDSSKIFQNVIPETEFLKFEYLEGVSLEQAKATFKSSDFYAVLYIPHIITYAPKSVQLYSNKQPSLGVKMHISNAIEKELERLKLKTYDIKDLDAILKAVKTNISIQTIKWTDDGKEEKTSTEIAMAVGIISGILIYFFIFMYGAQVMRGVIEEKTNRIVEVIVSSVKPFQLMMGKIIGVAMVGLTQFLLWVILTFAIFTVAKSFIQEDSSKIIQSQIQTESVFSSSGLQKGQPVVTDKTEMINDAFSSLKSINFGVMLATFLFYFIGGYLLYASLFGAIGSAVDNEADTQQFMMPVTIPLILAIVMLQSIIQNPEGQLAFWFSIIPFTSPIVMMVRIPFGVPYYEIILSMVLLVLTFIGTTWMAAKIYRTGILMYGKKISYSELWKWLRYRN